MKSPKSTSLGDAVHFSVISSIAKQSYAEMPIILNIPEDGFVKESQVMSHQ